MIIVNGETLKCHRCGSKWLSIIDINEEEFSIWCNDCEECTLEDYIPTDKVVKVSVELKD
jgi:hypothetical protein